MLKQGFYKYKHVTYLLTPDSHLSWRRSGERLRRKGNGFTPPNIQFVIINNNPCKVK
ncbi:hypothetical protein HanIR_Chr13g0652281 [Helianthus annuus]|nr:hypothetical protein HanIR_Chr13g0652281 [Helianthus annuus]